MLARCGSLANSLFEPNNSSRKHSLENSKASLFAAAMFPKLGFPPWTIFDLVSYKSFVDLKIDFLFLVSSGARRNATEAAILNRSWSLSPVENRASSVITASTSESVKKSRSIAIKWRRMGRVSLPLLSYLLIFRTILIACLQSIAVILSLSHVGTISFSTGTRIKLDGKNFEFMRKIGDSLWQLEDLESGRIVEHDKSELLSLYRKQELKSLDSETSTEEYAFSAKLCGLGGIRLFKPGGGLSRYSAVCNFISRDEEITLIDLFHDIEVRPNKNEPTRAARRIYVSEIYSCLDCLNKYAVSLQQGGLFFPRSARAVNIAQIARDTNLDRNWFYQWQRLRNELERLIVAENIEREAKEADSLSKLTKLIAKVEGGMASSPKHKNGRLNRLELARLVGLPKDFLYNNKRARELVLELERIK